MARISSSEGDGLVVRAFSRVCRNDKVRDCGETVPNLSVSIHQLIETKVVPNACAPAEYNHCEDFAMFGGRIRDAFDAVEYRDAQGRFVSAHNVALSKQQNTENQ